MSLSEAYCCVCAWRLRFNGAQLCTKWERRFEEIPLHIVRSRTIDGNVTNDGFGMDTPELSTLPAEC